MTTKHRTTYLEAAVGIAALLLVFGIYFLLFSQVASTQCRIVTDQVAVAK